MQCARVLAACLVVSCGSEGATPDATPPPMTYRLGVFSAEPTDRPPRTEAPIVFIDGIERRQLEITYESQMASYGAEHVIEMRFGGPIVSKTITIEPGACLGQFPNAAEYSQAFCLYDSGDIRFGSVQVGGCIGDYFCLPTCGCGPLERCTSRVASTSPFVSHLGCAPAGPRKLGESCTLIADPDGAYDDCGGGLLCVGGTCHELCTPDDCASCSYIEGHAPELRVCLP